MRSAFSSAFATAAAPHLPESHRCSSAKESCSRRRSSRWWTATRGAWRRRRPLAGRPQRRGEGCCRHRSFFVAATLAASDSASHRQRESCSHHCFQCCPSRTLTVSGFLLSWPPTWTGSSCPSSRRETGAPSPETAPRRCPPEEASAVAAAERRRRRPTPSEDSAGVQRSPIRPARCCRQTWTSSSRCRRRCSSPPSASPEKT